MKLGRLLRDARKAAGMTQDEAAEWMGVERSQISNLETGEHEPRLSTLRKLSDTYGKTVSELIGESPPRQRRMNARERRAVDVLLAVMRKDL